jgi:hypothetical protein
MYEIYQSKQNKSHFVAVHANDRGENANGVRTSENLEFVAMISEDDKSRIAFDAAAARARIERDGFFAFSVNIQIREHVHDNTH